MATLSVTLPDPVKTRAEHQATAAGFATVDDYIADLIEADECVLTDSKVDSLVQEGLDSGPSIPWTPELMSTILNKASRTRSQK